MRRGRKLDVAFFEGLVNKIDLEIFKVADAAVDELGGPAGGAFGPVALFEKGDRKARAGGQERQTGAVDASADDG